MSSGAEGHHSNQDNKGYSKYWRRRFEKFLSKIESNVLFAWIITKTTLTIVALALVVLSPALLWPLLMGWPEPHCYVAFAIWITYFVTAFIIASVIGYLREQRTT